MNLLGNNPITADGDYDHHNLIPGASYTCAMKGGFGGGQISLSYPDPITGSYVAVDHAVFLESGGTEFDFIPLASTMRFNLIGSASASVSIHIVRHL